MTADNFIEIGGRFIEPVRPKKSLAYRSPYTTITFTEFLWKTPNKLENNYLPIKDNDYGVYGAGNLYSIDITTNEKTREALYFSNLYYLLNLIEVFKKNNKNPEIMSPQLLTQIGDSFLALHERKAQFYLDYGHFKMTDKRVLLNDNELGQINKIYENIELFERTKNLLNEDIKKETKALDALIKNFLYEEQIEKNFWQPSNKPLRVPVKTLISLAPGVPNNATQKELVQVLQSLKSTHKNIYSLSQSVAEQNAQSQLQGYALYFNDSLYGQGFYSYNASLRPSILEARIFHTPEQAKAFVARNTHLSQQFIVVELDFTFSKIVEQQDCVPGSMINSLIARKEARILNEKLGTTENTDNTHGVIAKIKNKI